ncbi:MULTISPECIES: hypothetical protein [Enterococcus]|nr:MULTISPECIES: hypothetical protein [Enterococcus]
MSTNVPTSNSTSTSGRSIASGGASKAQSGGSRTATSGGTSNVASSGKGGSSGKEYPKTGETLESSLQLSFIGLTGVLAALALMKKNDPEKD